jgi:hypothetical protein
MNGFDRQRAFSAVILLVMALFVAAGVAPEAGWRRWLRNAAVIGFGIAVLAALIEVMLWWNGGH